MEISRVLGRIPRRAARLFFDNKLKLYNWPLSQFRKRHLFPLQGPKKLVLQYWWWVWIPMIRKLWRAVCFKIFYRRDVISYTTLCIIFSLGINLDLPWCELIDMNLLPWSELFHLDSNFLPLCELFFLDINLLLWCEHFFLDSCILP